MASIATWIDICSMLCSIADIKTAIWSSASAILSLALFTPSEGLYGRETPSGPLSRWFIVIRRDAQGRHIFVRHHAEGIWISPQLSFVSASEAYRLATALTTMADQITGGAVTCPAEVRGGSGGLTELGSWI